MSSHVRFVPRIRRLISSDLVRARETAEPIATALGLEAIADPRWRERGLGEMEGKTLGEIAKTVEGLARDARSAEAR